VRRFLLIFLASAFLLSGCRSAVPPAAVVPQATPRPATGDSIGEAYSLIIQRSADPVDPAKVAAAGVKGLYLELQAEGFAPPDVPNPTFTPDPNQNLQVMEASVQSEASRYASKLTPGQVDDAVIASMAASVGDCHTTYFTPATFQEEQQWLQGQIQFGGIGASLRRTKFGEPLVIWRVFQGTPAEQAGLHGGDVIQAVDGRAITALSVQEVVDLIRGPVGRPVRLTVQSAGSSDPKTLTITRAQIQPPSVEHTLLPNGVGYVQLYGFPENVAGQFKQALDALDRQGATSWIIDLRDNGGGSLDAVTQVSSMFAPKNTLLYYLFDSTGKRTNYNADGSVRAHLPPMVALINDGTGSGGEIFAAVLRENGLARLVGTKTAGCVGTGQMFPLPSGGGVQVTVADLNTGQGKVLNKIGLSPDVAIDLTVQDLVAGRDPQLDRAIALIRTGQ
jgi:carboxyl-terminal processing protease